MEIDIFFSSSGNLQMTRETIGPFKEEVKEWTRKRANERPGRVIVPSKVGIFTNQKLYPKENPITTPSGNITTNTKDIKIYPMSPAQRLLCPPPPL